MVAATPASRDRYIDALRVLALAGVIMGHYIMGVVSWAPGRAHQLHEHPRARAARRAGAP